MKPVPKKMILRIELWHVGLLLVLLGVFGPTKLVQPSGLLLGGFFMGLNFLLLSYGIAWVLTPLASKGRVRAGIGLLLLKVIIFLVLLTMLFVRLPLDAISFSLGFSTLILAILLEAVRTANLET